MKPSLATKKISRAKARNAALLNQLATPGLGSLLARQWIAGTGQLLLSVIGFTLVMVWFVEELIGYYGQVFQRQAGEGSDAVDAAGRGRGVVCSGVVLVAVDEL